jgi:uncharacterized membrane protein
LLAETAPPAQTADAPTETLGGLFERLVGGRMLIWIGGIALALAGLFLVRYSIQIGLITPALRMAMAFGFGLLLVGAGEIARRRADSAVDPRVGQALVGAGVLVLYAAAYGSHVLYGLVGMRTASALMVGVTLAALGLALRHGAPAAVMGLVGGFLTPLLVGNPTATSVPLLTYLALLNTALFALASRRGWTWLAASAVLLSFGWTGLLAFLPPGQALPAGIFILVLSLAASLLRAGGGWHLDFLRPAAIGLAQLAILVARTDLGIPAWALNTGRCPRSRSASPWRCCCSRRCSPKPSRCCRGSPGASPCCLPPARCPARCVAARGCTAPPSSASLWQDRCLFCAWSSLNC